MYDADCPACDFVLGNMNRTLSWLIGREIELQVTGLLHIVHLQPNSTKCPNLSAMFSFTLCSASKSRCDWKRANHVGEGNGMRRAFSAGIVRCGV
jgi:hypothetical protein